MSNDLVKRICQTWIDVGCADECFWEGWPECPTPEDSLTPRMVFDRIEELEAKLARKDDLVQAAVAAALERAAQAVQMCIWGDHWRHDDFGDVEPEELADVIRSFADDPAEVAAILKKAAGGGSGMSDDLVAMARLAQRDERMSTGALYGDLADRIEELEAKLAQQDDLVQAAVAAKLIEVHDAIADYPLVAPDEMEAQHYDEQIGHCQSIILNLITEDAYAALDRVVAARFGMVRAEVVRLSVEGKIDREAAERLLAAIRKGRE